MILSPSCSRIFGGGPTEDDAGLLAGARQFRVLRQKTIAGMDRIDLVLVGRSR